MANKTRTYLGLAQPEYSKSGGQRPLIKIQGSDDDDGKEDDEKEWKGSLSKDRPGVPTTGGKNQRLKEHNDSFGEEQSTEAKNRRKSRMDDDATLRLNR